MTQQYQQSTGSTGQQTYDGGQFGQSTGTQQSFGGTGGQRMGGQRMGGQQMGGQQSGSFHESTHRTVGQQFESEMTPELNETLEAFDRVVEIAEWCADKCIESGQQMAECARLCQDLADLASLNEKLIARDSINGPELADAFLKVAQQGLPILQQHQQSYHVQETLQAVTQAIDATDKLLSSIGRQEMGQPVGIQEQVQSQGMSSQRSQGGSMSQQPQGQSFQSQQPQGQSFQQPQGQGYQSQGQEFQGHQSY